MRVRIADRIFYCNPLTICCNEHHKELERFFSFILSFDNFPFRIDSSREMSRPGIRQVGTRRVCNQQVPFANFMNLSVHCNHAPTPNGFESVTENVPFRVSARRFLNITRVGFVTSLSERSTNRLAFFASN